MEQPEVLDLMAQIDNMISEREPCLLNLLLVNKLCRYWLSKEIIYDSKSLEKVCGAV